MMTDYHEKTSGLAAMIRMPREAVLPLGEMTEGSIQAGIAKLVAGQLPQPGLSAEDVTVAARLQLDEVGKEIQRITGA